MLPLVCLLVTLAQCHAQADTPVVSSTIQSSLTGDSGSNHFVFQPDSEIHVTAEQGDLAGTHNIRHVSHSAFSDPDTGNAGVQQQIVFFHINPLTGQAQLLSDTATGGINPAFQEASYFRKHHNTHIAPGQGTFVNTADATAVTPLGTTGTQLVRSGRDEFDPEGRFSGRRDTRFYQTNFPRPEFGLIRTHTGTQPFVYGPRFYREQMIATPAVNTNGRPGFEGELRLAGGPTQHANNGFPNANTNGFQDRDQHLPVGSEQNGGVYQNGNGNGFSGGDQHLAAGNGQDVNGRQRGNDLRNGQNGGPLPSQKGPEPTYGGPNAVYQGNAFNGQGSNPFPNGAPYNARSGSNGNPNK